MDRTATDTASADVIVAEPDGGWTQPTQPNASMAGRISFGLTSSPISPRRAAAAGRASVPEPVDPTSFARPAGRASVVSAAGRAVVAFPVQRAADGPGPMFDSAGLDVVDQSSASFVNPANHAPVAPIAESDQPSVSWESAPPESTHSQSTPSAPSASAASAAPWDSASPMPSTSSVSWASVPVVIGDVSLQRDGDELAAGSGPESVDSAADSVAAFAVETAPSVARPSTAGRSRAITIGIAVFGVLAVLAGTALGVMYFTGSGGALGRVLKVGQAGRPSAASPAQRVVTAPLGGRRQASLELLAGADKVNLRIGELGDDLYRISTPADAGIRPSPVLTGNSVQVQVSADGTGTRNEIDVLLSTKVTWSLRFAGYVQDEVIDLTAGQISSIELAGATRHTVLTLPTPTGTVPITVAGAVQQLTLRSPAGSPVRVQVSAGAQRIVAGSRTLRDVEAGAKLTPKDWTATHRYDVNAAARMNLLMVETTAS